LDLRIQKTYEALFDPEKIRKVFREPLPAGPDADGETAVSHMAKALKHTLSDIESGTGQPKLRTIDTSLPLRDREEASGPSEKVRYLADAFDEIAVTHPPEVIP
jgi:hypothetical protein